MRKFFLASTFGSLLAFFFDPDRGARRRNITRDKAASMFRRFLRRSKANAEYLGGKAYGIVQETVPHAPDNPNPDDKTLKDRIESELFRSADFPKGDVNINVAEGVVEIRGTLPSATLIDETIAKVRAIPGVGDVHNFLHLPGTPAPNKAEGINAG